MTDDTMNSQASRYARSAWRGGWAPFPLPLGAKHPPPPGATGGAPWPASEAEWLARFNGADCNVGLRVPDGVIVIDVDAYGSKAKLAEESWRLLNLPPTGRWTARNPASSVTGKYAYRLPDGVDQADLVGGLPGIDVLRLEHRYVHAFGPNNDAEGALVTYYGADGLPSVLPDVATLPRLTRDQIAPLLRGAVDHGEAVETTIAALRTSGAVTDCSHVARALATFMASMREPGRHDSMARAQSRLVALGVDGHAGVADALDQAKVAFIAAVTDRDDSVSVAAEFDRALLGAVEKATPANESGCHCPGDGIDLGAFKDKPVLEHRSPAIENAPVEDDAFWQAHPLLAWCAHTAPRALVSREALLGVLLARCAAEIAPRYAVESSISAMETNLNLVALLVGDSNTGKSSAIKVVDKAYSWTTGKYTPMSGEALLRGYLRTPSKSEREADPDVHTIAGTEFVQARGSLLMLVDEYGTLVSAKERGGNTIGGLMREMWDGGNVALDYVGHGKAVRLLADSYRWCGIMGVQPSFATKVFDGEGAGDTQRYLWFNAQDAWAAEQADEIDADDRAIKPLAPLLHLARWTEAEPSVGWLPSTGIGQRVIVKVEQPILDEIRQSRIAAMAGGTSVDGHTLQIRLRVAAILAMTDGLSLVDVDHWTLAGIITTRSSARRESLRDRMGQESRKSAESQGVMEAIKAEAGERHKIDNLATGLVKMMKRHSEAGKCVDGCTRGCLTAHAGRNTEFVGQAIDMAITRGLVVEAERPGKRGKPVAVWQAL